VTGPTWLCPMRDADLAHRVAEDKPELGRCGVRDSFPGQDGCGAVARVISRLLLLQRKLVKSRPPLPDISGLEANKRKTMWTQTGFCILKCWKPLLCFQCWTVSSTGQGLRKGTSRAAWNARGVEVASTSRRRKLALFAQQQRLMDGDTYGENLQAMVDALQPRQKVLWEFGEGLWDDGQFLG
jgi:hypothetical protein